MKKINVGFYGGKEKPLEADEIYCDMSECCSLCQNGKCLRVRASHADCIYGRTETHIGYTTRAKKYDAFRSRFASDEAYRKLESSGGTRLAVIGDYVYLYTLYVEISFDNGEIKMKTPHNTPNNFIPKEMFTAENIRKILNYKPYTLYGHTIIRQYADEIVPQILVELKQLMPDVYAELSEIAPELCGEINYVGRTAYVSTMVQGSVLSDGHYNYFTLRGSELVCEEYRTLLPFGADTGIMTIPVTEKMTYQITDNAQVDENTRFA